MGKGKGGQICGGRWSDLGGGHTMQHTDYVSDCALETYMMILSTHVTPINLIKIKKKTKKWL